MESTLLLHRIHFAFTITFHYLFPQLTMGLAPLILVFKTMALRTKNDFYNEAARFWAKIFGINFLMGVVTGIPMEFQFGTNWSQFARLTGGVIGQPLVMEGVFAFFVESAFQVTSFWGLLLNPWALIQYTHNMSGAVVTGAFVMAAVGAYYIIDKKFEQHGRQIGR